MMSVDSENINLNVPSDPPIEAELVASHSGPVRNFDSGSATATGIQNRWAVLAILFLVTGVLGLPLLWLCKSFTTAERIFWAVTVSLYTAGLVWVVAQICWWSIRQIQGL